MPKGQGSRVVGLNLRKVGHVMKDNDRNLCKDFTTLALGVEGVEWP